MEYEKKWINWRDHLKQKCEVLKKKRELKLSEKKVNLLLLINFIGIIIMILAILASMFNNI